MERQTKNGTTVAVFSAKDEALTDVSSALDRLMTAKYEGKTALLAFDKAIVAEDFFILRRGLAGEILQKFINYQGKIEIYGDFSGYTSKPPRDFIYESNRGRDVFFVATKEEAVNRLIGAQY